MSNVKSKAKRVVLMGLFVASIVTGANIGQQLGLAGHEAEAAGVIIQRTTDGGIIIQRSVDGIGTSPER